MGIGDWVGAPTAALVNDIAFDVIENGVVVSCGGRRTYFSDVTSATSHIAKYLEDGKEQARAERAAQEAERQKYKERAADPLGGLGDPKMVEKLMGLASAATGVPAEVLQQLLRDRLGVEGWRSGEPPVS
jgi:hypothetical protein